MAQPEPDPTPIRGALLAGPANRHAGPRHLLAANGVTRGPGLGVAAPEGVRLVETAGRPIHPGLMEAHMRGHGDNRTLEPLLVALLRIGAGRSPRGKKPMAPVCATEGIHAEVETRAAAAPLVADRAVHMAVPGFAEP